MLTCRSPCSTTVKPASVVLSSALGSGAVYDNVITATATFDTPVTGVTVADFNGGSPFPVETGVTYALTGGPSAYVLTATLNQPVRADKALTFDFAAGSGAIEPPATASTVPLPFL